MFDFSLPPATAVLPIEPHDFQAPSLHPNAQVYGYTSDSPPPPSPKLSIDTLANYSGIDNPQPPPSPKLSIDTLASYSGIDNPAPPPPSQ